MAWVFITFTCINKTQPPSTAAIYKMYPKVFEPKTPAKVLLAMYNTIV